MGAMAAERQTRGGTEMKKYIGIAISIFLLAGCGTKSFTAPNESMEPTIKKGSHVLVVKEYYRKNPIQRFDVVVVKDPDGKDKEYVKRVIGLGGENLAIRSGKIFINEKELAQPFANIAPDKDFGPVKIPENEYFLLGDNRPNSYDSRYWKHATVSKNDMLGKVVSE